MKTKKKGADVSIHGSGRRKSLYEVSLTFFLLFWCFFFVLQSCFGYGQRRLDSLPSEDGSSNVSARTQLDFYFPSSLKNNYSSCGLEDSENPRRKSNGVEDATKGGNASASDLGKREEGNPGNHTRNSQSGYIGLDEFKNQTLQRKESDADKLQGKMTHRLEPDGLEYNYASSAKGAKVLDHNKEAKGVGHILCKDEDKYLRNRCSTVPKFVVIELSEETLVDSIEIANLEHYSSNFKDFELWGSLSYPTETWTLLGIFTAENVKHAQRFMLAEPKWSRYTKLNLVSHYGSEFYCTLSHIKVFGVDAIEWMLEDLIVVPEEPAATHSSSKVELKHSENPEASLVQGAADDHVKVDQNLAKSGVKVDLNLAKNGVKVDPNLAKNGVKVDPNLAKNGVRQESALHPKQSTGRIPSDGILKILMQKIRSMELNLSILEEYIKEHNLRYGDTLPDLQKQFSQSALLLEKTNSEMKYLRQWRQRAEEELHQLESWRSSITSELDDLVRDNVMFRENFELLQNKQDFLESKEIAVILLSLFFACLALFKLAWERVMALFKPCESRHRSQWLLIFVSSSLTFLITLLYS